MKIAEVNGLLELVALLNQGADHNCSYEAIQPHDAATLHRALDEHFGSFINWRTKAPHQASEWGITIKRLEGDTRQPLKGVVMHWCFETHCSPQLGERRAWVGENVVAFLVDHVLDLVGDATLDEVYTSPPIWYEATWQDFVLSSDSGRWLLHFGITD